MSDDTDWSAVSDNAHREFRNNEAAKEEEERLCRIEGMIVFLIESNPSLMDYQIVKDFLERIEK